MIEPDAPTRGPRWPFRMYQRIGWWAQDRHASYMRKLYRMDGRWPLNHHARALAHWSWKLWAWTIRRRDPKLWEYEREQSAILLLASLLVALAVWWLVGMP